MADRQGIPNSIRCAYSTGDLKSVEYESTHSLPTYPVMIKLGRGLDESDEPGIFKL